MSRTRFHALLPVWLTALALAGCAQLFPPPRIPEETPPAGYRPALNPPRLQSASGDQTLRTAEAPPARWWRLYGSAQLDALVEEGLAHNLSISQAAHQLAAARQALRASEGASELPAFDAALVPVRQRVLNLPVFPQPTALENVYTAQVSASYTFDFFGQAYRTNRALASQAEQQAWQWQAVQQDVAYHIVAGAIRIAALERQCALLQRQHVLAREQAGRMAARQRLGSVPPDPLWQREQQIGGYTARLAACERDRTLSANALALLLGRTPDRPPAVPAIETLRLPADLPLTIPSRLLQQRPDILAARAAARAAADQAGAAAAALYPSLTLSAAMGRSGYAWSDLTSPANAIWSVGASLTQPLFHGGALRARRDQAQEGYEVALAQYRQTVIAAFSGVSDALARLEEDARSVGALDAQRTQGERLWRNSRSRHALGAGTPDDAASAEQGWLDIQQQYTQAQAGRLADSAALYRALGAPVSGE